MTTTDLVRSVAAKTGNDALEGAIIIVALDRPLDRLIQESLGLSCYHPGRPSPWSHTFLLAEPFNGENTKILDCTIRDKDDQIAWTLPLIDSLKAIVNKAGRIYSARLGDYDDPRVHPAGIKILPDIPGADRRRIVTAGLALQARGLHYDFLGLFRELIRMLLHVHIKPGDDLFCSAFCQEAYRNALGAGSVGDFMPGVLSRDVSPDDIWFSRQGTNYPEAVPLPRLEDLALAEEKWNAAVQQSA